jgi:DNA-binding response OmpR family regulator
MRESTILLVEDETSIREGLRDALEGEGYRVLEAPDGVKGLHLGLTQDPDLVILDLMLPGMDGFDVLERLRSDGVETPVLCLTARGLEQDRVKGLQLGADDYIVKPFGLRELLARVDARLRAWDRERGLVSKEMLHFGAVSADFVALRVLRSGEEVHLSPQEFDLLRFFASNEGKALSRSDLLAGVWGEEVDAVSRVVDNGVMALRKKLGSDHFASVRGVGYRFDRSPTKPGRDGDPAS